MKLIELKNDKGQAAMTDSLFFLTIIVALCVLLFKFSSTYGERIDLAINNLYFKEYTNSSLKAIYYTNIPLDFDKNILNSKETDYLITAIKSDYLFNQKIGGSDVNSLNKENVKDLAKYNLFHTIKSLMHPLPNYDYIYYIQNTSNDDFIYFMLKINEIKPDLEIVSKYYLCDPISITPVRYLVQRSNKLYSSSTPLIFKTLDSRLAEVRTVASLTMWPSTSSINNQLLSSTFEQNENISNLRCKEYQDPEEP